MVRRSSSLRLLSALLFAVAGLALFDLQVPHWLEADARRRADERRVETFRQVVFRNFEEAQESVDAAISRMYRRYAALPETKAPREIRIFLVGNSSALFGVDGEALERLLAASRPTQPVRVVPLMVPDIGVREEHVLVRAALAKGADVVVLMPNYKGLILGHEIRLHGLLARFDAGAPAPWRTRPGDALRDALGRHWNGWRARDELRGIALRALRRALPLRDERGRERAAIEAAFAELAAAAARRDVGGLLEVYRRRGLHRFIPDAVPPAPVPKDVPVFRIMRRTAGLVRASGALGVAVFLPVNPIFRDPVATRDFPSVEVDDARLRELARRSLEIYARAGFATANALDALPPGAFIDLVHANAEGMERLTGQLGQTLEQALTALGLDVRSPALSHATRREPGAGGAPAP